ncbi:MAG: MFS transporter [Rhodospirillales bacterium]
MPSPAAVTATALSATLAVQALVTMSSLAMPIMAPSAAPDIGSPPSVVVGVYSALVYLGAMTATLFCGGFVVRYGAILTSQAALAICAAGLAIATAAAWPLLVVAALVVGLGYGPTTPASSHVLSRHTSPRLMSLVFSIKQTGVPIGGMIAGVLIPALVVTWGWQGAAYAVGAIALAGALAIAPTRRRFDADREPGATMFRGGLVEPLRLVLRDRALRTLVITSSSFSATQQCLTAFLVTYLVSDVKLTLVEAGLVLSVSQAGGIAGRIVWGAVADWIGRARAVLAGLGLAMAVTAGATALFAPSWPMWAMFAVAAAYGATAVGWNGVFLAEVARVAPRHETSRATGGALTITFAGVVVSPPLFGILVTLTGSYAAGFFVLAGFAALSGLVLSRPAPARPQVA